MPSALITVADAKSHMLRSDSDIAVPALRVYHNGTSSAATCTVAVTGGATASVVMVITGGANAGTYTYLFSTYTTVASVVNGLNDAGRGFLANAEGDGSADSTDILIYPATNCLLQANEQLLLRSDEALLQTLIYGVSDAIESICGRTFAAASYTQWRNGNGQRFLSLPQAPINYVTRMSRAPRVAVRVTNTSTSHTAATVRVSDTAVVLTHVSSAGTATSNSLAFATYATATTMAAAITAVGNGWSATVADSTVANAQSSTMRPQGGLNALGVDAPLEVPDLLDGDYSFEPESGVLESGGGFPRGNRNIFVEYNAGYSTVPYAVQQLCAELVAQAYNHIRTGEGVSRGSLGDMSFDKGAFVTTGVGLIVNSNENRERLAPWIRYRCG